MHNTTYVAGVFGSTVSGGAPVSIDSKGHLGTVTSSSRFKHDIQPMGPASNSILALQPVTYRYKEELDPDHVPQFGLVAEEVAKVNPDLVVRDEQGRPYTVRYEAVNAMLLNESLKEHRRVATLEETVAQLKSALEKQAAQIEKVSAQLQTERPAPRVVSSAP
ncbi:MAG: tail fiber domain-containing protein [Chthoniobacterales bacterium]|nr:tail fiber domain-containing protein [Chthoniobacterales bacterium]